MASPFDLFTEAPAGASSTPTQPQQPSRFDAFVGAGEEDLTKPALLYRKQPAKALEARAVEVKAEEAKQSPFSDLYQDDKKFKTVYDYALSRFGKEGEMRDGETREDYVARWASHMRMTSNNILSGTQELQYLNNAKREDILKAKAAYDIWDNTAGYFSPQGGQGGVKPILDVLGSVVSDPTTAISLGAGKIASSTFMKTATEKGLQAAIKSRLGTLAAVPAVEGSGAALSDVTAQKIDLTTTKAQVDQMKELLPKLSPEQQAEFQPQVDALQAKVDAGVSGAQAALAGAIGAVGGTLETGALLGTAKAAKGKAVPQLTDILDARKPKAADVPTVEVKAVKDPTEKALEDQYDIFEGRKLLDAEGKPTSVAEMQIRNDVNNKAAEVAKEVWTRVPDLAPQAGQKVSDAVKNVFMNIEQIDDVVLQDSLAKAGITAEEFARMNRTTVGDAGRTLQAYSVLARLQNKLKSIDPAAAKQVDEMYGNRNTITSAFTGLRDFGMRLDRELKALMVSQVATTIRNGFSGAAVVTFGAASEALESSLYRMGKTVGELATGKPVTGSFTGGLKGVYDDAVRTTFYLGQTDLSSDVAERLLAGSPKLHEMIIKTAGETGDARLSKIGQIANTFNVAQDAFFRKAIFTASVEKQLGRVGINMYDVLAQGKSVPFDVLRNATDEALTATFSKMPTKGPMFHAIKFIEELGPIGSTVIPFPRFMANAMSWTYKHSPMGIFSGATDVAVGAAKQAKGDAAGLAQTMVGLENVSKGAVGTAAIYAAYKYRKENQDTPWYDVKNPDGSLVDARALFPAAPFLAMGDYLVKFENARTDEFKTKEFLEAMTGFKAPAGTYSWLGDKFAESLSNMQTGEGSADQKISTFFGEWMGEYLGRALVPVQQISDIIGAIDRDETLPRDAYQIPAGKEGFTESAKQQLMKRTPVVKQELPVYQPATKEEAAFNDAGPLKLFTGITVKGKPTELEEEITRLKIPSNKIFTSTGDKIVDANARKVMAPLLLQTYEVVKETEWYKTASQDVQKIALQNTIAFAQKNAKEIATNESAAEAFAKGEGARIFAVKYSALPPEVKRATAEMYEQQTGKKLEDTKEYQAALSYAAAIRKQPGFAGGGLLSDVAGKVVGKTVTKSATELLQEMEQAVGKKVMSTADQTAKALPTPAEAPKAVSKTVNPAEVAPSKPSAFDAFVEPPVSVEKAAVAPMPETPAAFSEYQMQEAEKLLKSKMGSQYQLDAYKKAYPDEYQESINKLAADIEPAAKVEPVTTTEAPKVKEAVSDVEKDKVLTTVSNLNKPQFGYGETARKKTLADLKQVRAGAFDVLRNDDTFQGVDDSVIAVAQGDWRLKNKAELNLADPEEMQKFTKMTQDYQKKYDKLQQQYADYPPVRLYHGSTSERTPEKLRRGFLDPQEVAHKKHFELDVGATSFTKDLRLNYTEDAFGGGEAKNISFTEMPRADYEFRKIDMSLKAYKDRDMNTIAQAVTGSPTVARPLSLPRSFGYKESESAFVESEKLGVKTDQEQITKQFGIAAAQEKVRNKLWGMVEQSVGDLVNNKASGKAPAKELTQANNAYRNIKMFIANEFRETGGKKATEKGFAPIPSSSQTTQKLLESMSKNMMLDIRGSIDEVAGSLEATAPDKAAALKQLKINLDRLATPHPAKATVEDEQYLVKKKIEAVNNIRDLVGGGLRVRDQRLGLAKGGLASRR